MAEDDNPSQQFRIFDAAHCALTTMGDLPHEERLAAIATMLAIEVGHQLLEPDHEAHALAYVASTVQTLLPETRSHAAILAKQMAN